MLGRLLCALGWHRWRVVAWSGTITALVCRRCLHRMYCSNDGITWWEEPS